MSGPLFQIDRFSLRYPQAPTPALQEISLTMAQGERLALIGESGSGKSTLARAIAGLSSDGVQVTGAIHWPQGAPRLGADLGYVFQDPAGSLNPLLSIGAHLVEVLRQHQRLTAAQARAKAEDLLTEVRIPQPAQALRAFPHQFSGGQRQRIAIALAIAADPQLLIADEATSALDVLVQAEIMALLQDLVTKRGMALAFITHDIALAARMADRIAVMHQGRIVELGSAPQIITAPRDPYTRMLLAAHIDLASPRLIGTRP